MWAAEKESLDQAVLSFKSDSGELRELNEGLQIQLQVYNRTMNPFDSLGNESKGYSCIYKQETHSANDCISAQLEEARREVLRMQDKVEHAEEVCHFYRGVSDHRERVPNSGGHLVYIFFHFHN